MFVPAIKILFGAIKNYVQTPQETIKAPPQSHTPPVIWSGCNSANNAFNRIINLINIHFLIE